MAKFLALGISLAAIGLACTNKTKPKPQPTDTEPVETAPQVRDATAVAPPTAAAKPHEFSGRFPGAEEDVSVSLEWIGGDKALALFDKPRGSSAGERTLKTGTKLEMLSTTLFVLEPIALTAKRAVSFEVPAMDGKPASTLKLAAGDVLDYYHYGSEGTCYVGQRGEVVYIDTCPDREDFDGHTADMTPVQQWWISIAHKGGEAWLLVDPALIRSEIK